MILTYSCGTEEDPCRTIGKPGSLLGDLFQDVQAKLRILAGFELVCAVAGSDRDREGVNAGSLDELFDLVGIGVLCLVIRDIDIILDAGQGAELSLDNNAVLMRILGDLAGLLDVLLEGMAGIVDHNGSEAVVYAVLAGSEICAVVQMQNDRDLRMQLYGRLYQLYQIDGVRILSGAGGSLQDQRSSSALQQPR